MLHYTLPNLQNEYIYLMFFTTLFKNMKKGQQFLHITKLRQTDSFMVLPIQGII